MTRLHELVKPIRKDQLEELRGSLESLQGNILQGHGRNHSAHIFLKFETGKEDDVKKWIEEELAEHITSAQRQLDEAEQYRLYKIPGRLFMSFFLSLKGYVYLDPDSEHRPRFNDKAFL